MNDEEPRAKRVLDTSSREAAVAVAGVARQLEPFRSRVALIAARTLRGLVEKDRVALMDECDMIQNRLRGIRQELIAALADSPLKVATHSRVLDVEKAIVNLGHSLSRVEARLKADTSKGHKKTEP